MKKFKKPETIADLKIDWTFEQESEETNCVKQTLNSKKASIILYSEILVFKQAHIQVNR